MSAPGDPGPSGAEPGARTDHPDPRPVSDTGRSGPRELFFRALGLGFVALGLVGAVLPLMPTTIFLILALACFARSSPGLHRWLLHHPRFGAGLRAWETDGVIPPTAKVLAVGAMAVSVAMVAATTRALWPPILTAAVLALVAAYVLSRPSRPPVPPARPVPPPTGPRGP